MDKIKIVKADTDLRDEIIRFIGEPDRQSTQAYNIHPCPFHAEKTIGAFHVWQDRYHCFSCGADGDVFDAWEHFTNKSLVELLKERGNIDPAEANQRAAEIEKRAEQARAAVEAERARQLEKLHESEKHTLYHDALRENAAGRQLWRSRGISEDWQAYWQLGYSPKFKYKTRAGLATSNTLVIPVKKVGGDVVTIRHRIVNALDGNKYRPEIAGLGAHPFICNTDIERANDLIIVEGEIKAMVTFATWDARGMQVIGVPSKSMMIEYIKMARGRNTVVVPDPDGYAELQGVCKEVGARMLWVPEKIDDFIIEQNLNARWLHNAVKQARRL